MSIFMHFSWKFTIVHVTVEVVAACLGSNPELLILKFHHVGKILDEV